MIKECKLTDDSKILAQPMAYKYTAFIHKVPQLQIGRLAGELLLKYMDE